MIKKFKTLLKRTIFKTRGVTRIVFVFDKFVIKIPNFTVTMNNFLLGCYCNWSERYLSKTHIYIDKDGNKYDINDKIAKSYFCSWFGLILIQEKIKILSKEQFEICKEILIRDYSDVCSDIKHSNFGHAIRINKQILVTNDYGQNF